MTSRSSAYVGLTAVAAIWAVSAIANAMAGYQLSSNPDLSRVLAAASVACDVLKAITLFVILGAFIQRRWVVVGLAAMLLVLTTGWSMRSAVYFASWGIADRANTLRHKESVAEAEMLLVSTKQQRARFLAEQHVDPTSKYRSLREAAKEANAASAAEFSKIVDEIQADLEKIKDAKPTPVIDPIAEVMDLPHAQVALWTALAFALLLEMSSATGFWLISRSRLPKTQVDKKRVAKGGETLPLTPPPLTFPTIEETTVSRTNYAPSEMPKPNSEADFPDKNPVAITCQPANPEKLNTKLHVNFSHDIHEPNQVVDADVQRLVQKLRVALVQANVNDRLTLNEVSFAVNRLLPSSKRLHKKHERAGKLSEALLIAFPDCEKRRAGGQTWIHGVRLADLVPASARA
jgi:hypothetical protein